MGGHFSSQQVRSQFRITSLCSIRGKLMYIGATVIQSSALAEHNSSFWPADLGLLLGQSAGEEVNSQTALLAHSR